MLLFLTNELVLFLTKQENKRKERKKGRRDRWRGWKREEGEREKSKKANINALPPNMSHD